MLIVYNQFSSKNYCQWLAIETNKKKMERRLKRLKKSSYQNLSRYEMHFKTSENHEMKI